MIISITRIAAGLVVAAGLTGLAMHEQPNSPRGGRWKKVDEAVAKGLPKTAIDELGPIIQSAMADKAYPEAVKAIAKKIALEGTIEGNKPEERITRMKAAIASRRKLFAEAARDKLWVAGAHLPFPGLGHVRRDGNAFAWVPIEYGPLRTDRAD